MEKLEEFEEKKDLNSRVDYGRFKKSPEWRRVQAKAFVSSTIMQLEHDQGLTELKRKQVSCLTYLFLKLQ